MTVSTAPNHGSSTPTGAGPTRSPAGHLDLSPSAPLLLNPKTRTYTQQFANLYFNRLTSLRPHVHARAARKWHAHASAHVQRTLDIKPNSLVWFIGTLVRISPAAAQARKIWSDQDKVAIEDEYGRVVLEVDEYLSRNSGDKAVPLITGVVAAVIGTETKSGGFQVADMCFAGLPDPEPERPLAMAAAPNNHQEGGEWIALVSGLHFGSPSSKPLPLIMLAHYLVGNIGTPDDQHLMSLVSRLFILGNSISVAEDPASSAANTTATTTADDAYATLDACLGLIAKSMPITLLPGADDPATHLMPQQPMHKSLFMSAVNAGEGRFKSVTNPMIADWNGNNLVFTSGQPLDDVFKYLDPPSRLSLACHFLTWRHIAPTAPDTLWCYPYVDKDPFVLVRRPKVFAVGNQPHFETCLYDDNEGAHDHPESRDHAKVRVVLVPEFRTSGQLVLVNTKTLEYHVVTLDVDQGNGEQVDDEDAMDTSE
ncbi:DNA polymerase alpha/epsilon subunit B-domain-containing protein [Catenaria anguillulae PL171]|uniref:DNA polymerase alpha/epsilon subunit B-domain-containing protein n=1 Tax=Catenaria anguillulae PL171 TaxID=765915 RepID=A0A1Y2HYE0_9FUNG|nr:DNA polymerase alpha/epsilon subunit B-domain-containing protein [Catenaria anguillulae PL171]